MLTIKSNTEDELARIASALENMNGGSTANVGGGVLVQLSPIAGSSGEYEITDYTAAELYAMCMSRPVTFLKHEYVPENMVPGATNVIQTIYSLDPVNYSHSMYVLEKCNIVGTKLYLLYNDMCSNNFDTFLKVINGLEQNKIDKERLIETLSQTYPEKYESFIKL